MKRKMSFLLPLLVACVAFMSRVNAQTAQELQVRADAGDAEAQVQLGIYYQNGCRGVAIDSVKAMQLFEEAAVKGNNDAKVYLSYYYLSSKVVPHDTLKCYTLRKEAADAGCAYGIAALGICYNCGYGVKADTAKAVQLFEQAFKKGDAYAAYALSIGYFTGSLNIKKDPEKGFELSKKAFQWGYNNCYDMLAAEYYKRNKIKEAWDVINKGLEVNDVDSRIQAANFYADGIGVARDERKALALYNGVLQQCPNNAWAAQCVSLVYEGAADVSLRDTAAAIEVLEKTATCGGTAANYYLGNLYYYSYGQYSDRGKALQYFLKGLDEGSDCYRIAGLMYIMGDGTEKDTEKGLALLKEGYAKKYSGCAGALGDAYCSLLNDNLDYARAENYYKKAVEWGGTESEYESLFRFYIRQSDASKAMAVAQQAADAGIATGYYWLSQVLDANGNTKDAVKALNKGLKAGDEFSGLTLAECYERGSVQKQDYNKAARIYDQLGTPQAQYHKAVLLFKGNIGDSSAADRQKAISLLQQSAARGCNEALYMLGCIYEVKDYGVQNIDSALGCFTRMAEAGEPEGYFKIGEYYEVEFANGDISDSAKCIEYYQKAAARNHAGAMCYLADFYKMGRMLPADSAKAFELYSQAMNLNYVHAYDDVARCYLEGVGVPVDSVKAVSYLRVAAANGEGTSFAYLGNFYEKGLATLVANNDSAMYYYRQGSAVNDPTCNYRIGSVLYTNKQYDKAFQYYYSAAVNGNADAIVAMAECLQEGSGTKADPQEAYRLLQYAAHQYGNPNAYSDLGTYHIYGTGCTKDYTLAKSYFDTAAALGSSSACYKLGICYRDGVGCTADSISSLQWFEKAADAGNVRAINELGDMYESGTGVPQDYKKAVAYYQVGVDKYYSLTSMCNLGYCYEQGNGVVLNSTKAFELYNRAAEAGSSRGMLMVACCYAGGVSVKQDFAKAEEWFVKSAAAGSVTACYNLGIMYEKGEEGVPADKKKAVKYYTQAADAGYEPAQTALNNMKSRKK